MALRWGKYFCSHFTMNELGLKALVTWSGSGVHKLRPRAKIPSPPLVFVLPWEHRMSITSFNDWEKIKRRIVFVASKLSEIHMSVSIGRTVLEHGHTHWCTEGCSRLDRCCRDGDQQSVKDPLSKL